MQSGKDSSVTLHNIVTETTNLDQDAVSFFENYDCSLPEEPLGDDLLSNPTDTRRVLVCWADAKRLDYKTKNQWCLEDRNLKKGERANAVVVRLFHIADEFERQYLLPHNFINYDGELYRTEYQIPVYHVSQTKPAKIQQRTKDYYRLFRLLNYKSTKYIRSEQQQGWRTKKADTLFESEFWQQDLFTVEKLKQHINCHEVLGGIAEKSAFGILDLDMHSGSSVEAYLDGLGVILNHLPKLLRRLRASRVFHQVADEDAKGIHVGFFFPRLVRTDTTEKTAREWLEGLADRFPAIHQRWVESGLRPWEDTEVYPNDHNGCRLLMCRGRTMLTDRPLPLLQGRKYNGMHDLVSFMEYLDGDSEPMPVDAVLSYLAERLNEPFGLASSDGDIIPIETGHKERATRSTTNSSRRSQETKIIWKNRTRPNLIKFWSGHWNPAGSLNEVLGVQSRLAPYYLPNAQEIAQERLEQFVNELPEAARDCSGRLMDGLDEEVFAVISRCLDKAYAGNTNQKDSAISQAKLEESVQHWQKVGFDPFDKSTWLSEESPVRFTVDWTKDDIEDFQRLKHYFGRAKDIDPVVLVGRCLELVLMKNKEGNGIALNYWKIFFTERFDLACGDTANRKHQRIVQELQDLGIIKVSKKPVFSGGHRATMYDFGERVAERKGWEILLTDEEKLERIIAA